MADIAPTQVTPPSTTGQNDGPPPTFGTTPPPPAPEPAAAPAPNQEAPKPADPNPAEPPAPETPPAPERVVPERYDLKLPEGAMMDQASLARIESYAKTNQLTQEEATALVQAQEADVKAYVAEKKAGWLKEVQNDREIGGANLDRNVQVARQFLDQHADQSFRQELDRTGYGNHPGFLRFVLKLAKASANDTAVMPSASPGVPEQSLADLFYANTTSKKQ